MQSVKTTGSAEHKPTGTGQWIESTMGLLYVVGDNVQFCDDHDHWANGFCRLLELPPGKARALIERAVVMAQEQFGKLLSACTPEQQVAALTEATTQVLYAGPRTQTQVLQPSWGTDWQGSLADRVYSHSISGDRSRFVVGNSEHEFAWLIDSQTNQPVMAESVVYDEKYFGPTGDAHYGMKSYLLHADWRLEKSRRLVRTVLDNIGDRKEHWLKVSKSAHVMDIGSGIGYYRKAFDEYGLDHHGIDLSPHIIAKCKEYFGFDTSYTELFQLAKVVGDMKFQMITMWDLIEHLDDPAAAVRFLKDFMSEDGVLVVRTPNLTAVEADILGDYNYSFKFEHIRYFSPRSLEQLMQKCGLKPVYVETASHIFKGVFGADYSYKLGAAMRGADILGIYGK